MKWHCIFTLKSVQFHYPQLAVLQDNTHRLTVRALAKNPYRLSSNVLRIDNILPPVIVDAIFPTSHVWEVFEPPLVV